MSNPVTHPFDLLLDIDKRCRAAAHAMPADHAEPIGMAGQLAVRLGDHRLMLSLDEISEMIPLPVITKIPGVKPWLMGIANLRGTVISVVNLGMFLLGRAGPAGSTRRIVVVSAGDWSFGLLVDEVIGMRHFMEQNQALLDDVPAALKPYVSEVYHIEDHQWMVFNVEVLLQNANFLDAAA